MSTGSCPLTGKIKGYAQNTSGLPLAFTCHEDCNHLVIGAVTVTESATLAPAHSSVTRDLPGSRKLHFSLNKLFILILNKSERKSGESIIF